MFTIWDVAARPLQYDWQSVPAIPRSRSTEAWDDNLRDPGEPPVLPRDSREAPARRVRNPYAKVLEREQEERPRVTARVARDLMTSPVIFLTPDDTVADAWALVRERRFRHVPILASVEGPGQRRLVGIVSDRDLLRVAGTPEHVPTDDVGNRFLRTLMRTPVFSALPDTPIRGIAEVMFHEHIGAMPICDDTGALVGILTRSDVLRALLSDGPLDLWI